MPSTLRRGCHSVPELQPSNRRVDPGRGIDELITTERRAGACVQGYACRGPPADWHLAVNASDDLSGPEQALARARAWCDATVDPGPAFRCDSGGSVSWHDGDELRFAYFDDHVDRLEAAPENDPRRVEHLDPTTVGARFVDERYQELCVADWDCRLLGADATVEGDRASMLALFQSNVPTAGYSTTLLTLSLERLVPGGETWWVTALEETTDASSSDDEDARREWEDAAACCDIVIYEPPAGSTFGTTPEP